MPEAGNVMPVEAFLHYGLGLEEEDVEFIQELRDELIKEEEKAAAARQRRS